MTRPARPPVPAASRSIRYTYPRMDRPTYSLVVPLYNEIEVLPALAARLRSTMRALDGPAEVVMVDDGSRDGTYEALIGLHHEDARFKIVHLSRNFGHQVAVTAGLDVALGDAVVILDADLQDPPEVIHELIAKWREGYDVVHAVRERREGEAVVKRTLAAGFYRLLRRYTEVDVPVDAGDFRLVDRAALDAFRAMRESDRYVRGMFAWVGFRQTSVRYARKPRAAGEPKYTLRKSARLAVDGMIGFSTAPLRIILNLGFIVALAAFVTGCWAIYARYSGRTVPGWASLAIYVSFLNGMVLVMLGIVGTYVGRIYAELKHRPLYIVRETHGISAEAGGPRAVVPPAQRPTPVSQEAEGTSEADERSRVAAE